MTAAQHAADYAALGFGVFPVQSKGKAPATPHGLKDAILDPAMIARWPARANIGLLPPEPVLVLDADTADEAERLEHDYPELRNAPRCDTPSGGAHLYTRFPNGATPPKATVKVQGRNLDVRGMGRAYLVAPPSSTPAGRYTWARPLVTPAELPETPAGVLALLTPPKPPTVAPSKLPTTPPDADRARCYALTALQDEYDLVASAATGSRNATLNRAAFNLGQLVGRGVLDRTEVEDALRAAAVTCGLEACETETTLKSGLNAGVAQPREIPTSNRTAPRANAKKLDPRSYRARVHARMRGWTRG